MNANWLKYLPRLIRDRLEGQHHLQKAIGNSGWLLLDKILRMAAGLVIGIWMARVLGPVQFGRFNYALAFVALFAPIATLGLDGIVVRNLVMGRESPQVTLGSVSILRLFGALMAIILCNAAVIWFKPDDSLARLLVLIISFGFIFQSSDVVDCWFQSQVTSKHIVLAKLPTLLIFFGVRILLLLGGFSLYLFAWAQILESLMVAIGVVATYRICGNSFRQWHPDFKHALVLLREAWPQALARL
ncbi:MAG: oligosaccharide flippase family protein, partial [Burkholderiales bacterium]|nr:oligosaccharide flippase family protein [Burkholderiales bacterium]